MPKGGKRPGAGAPCGNRNALRHGAYSKYVQQRFMPFLDSFPELQSWLLNYQRKQTRNKRGPRKSDAPLVNALITIFQLPPDHPSIIALGELHPAFYPDREPTHHESPTKTP